MHGLPSTNSRLNKTANPRGTCQELCERKLGLGSVRQYPSHHHYRLTLDDSPRSYYVFLPCYLKLVWTSRTILWPELVSGKACQSNKVQMHGRWFLLPTNQTTIVGGRCYCRLSLVCLHVDHESLGLRPTVASCW